MQIIVYTGFIKDTGVIPENLEAMKESIALVLKGFIKPGYNGSIEVAIMPNAIFLERIETKNVKNREK